MTVDTYLNGFGNESTIPIKRSFMTGNFSFKVIQMDLRQRERIREEKKKNRINVCGLYVPSKSFSLARKKKHWGSIYTYASEYCKRMEKENRHSEMFLLVLDFSGNPARASTLHPYSMLRTLRTQNSKNKIT